MAESKVTRLRRGTLKKVDSTGDFANLASLSINDVAEPKNNDVNRRPSIKEKDRDSSFLFSSSTRDDNSKSEEETAVSGAKVDELTERELERLADEEFNILKSKPNLGSIATSSDPACQKIVKGFRINFMTIADETTGSIIWRSTKWGDDMFERLLEEYIPKTVLDCTAVMREINFSSMEAISNFRVEQRVFLHGQCVEEWIFNFGFVIPGSTNNWQTVVKAAAKDEMIPASVLSGNVTIESSFFDGASFLCKNLVLIYYV